MDPKERAIEFGQRLRRVRQKSSESLRDIEQRSGLNSGYLSQLENGKIVHPSPSVLQKVAKGYELRFEDLLKWAGYVEDSAQQLSTNQAVALSSVSGLGDPSDEELQTLRAIVELLQKKRSAPFSMPPADLPLDPEALRLVRGYTTALLREADAIGRRPTPLEDVQAAARLVLTEELTLDPNDKARLRERFGRWVNLAWRRLQGSFDFRAEAIWVKPDLHPSKRRFVISHEIGHAIIPAHRESFAYVDDASRLPPFARDLFEREANQAAVEILLQGGQAVEEFDSSVPSLRSTCNLADEFGASIVATTRYVVENSRRSVALALCHVGYGGQLGPSHLYVSKRFESALGWCAGAAPWEQLRPSLQSAATELEETWTTTDRRGNPHLIRVHKLHTGYTAMVLLAPQSRVRAATRQLLAVGTGREPI